MLRYVTPLLSVLLPVAALAQIGQVPMAVQPPSASSGPTLVQSANVVGSAGNSVTTTAADFSHATFIAIMAGSTTNLPTVSDSSGNSWTPVSAQTYSFLGISMWYNANPTTSTTQTFTLGGTNIQTSGCVMGFTGVATSSPIDQNNGAGTSLVTSFQAGQIIPTASGELYITTNVNDPSGAAITSQTINDGFTVVSGCTNTLVSGVSVGTASAYFVQATAATINPTWTYNNQASQTGSVIASFKP